MSDETRAAAEAIIAKCDSAKDLESHIIHYASVLEYLMCHMGKQIQQDESGIRELYQQFAEMAVREFKTPNRRKDKPVRH
mgnify:CR=1 FL=1